MNKLRTWLYQRQIKRLKAKLRRHDMTLLSLPEDPVVGGSCWGVQLDDAASLPAVITYGEYGWMFFVEDSLTHIEKCAIVSIVTLAMPRGFMLGMMYWSPEWQVKPLGKLHVLKGDSNVH